MTYESYRDALLKIALEQGCSDAEVFAQESNEFSVEVMEQQIDSYSVSRSMGLSVRVCLEGKDGYAYTELFEDPEGLVARAMDNARAAETTDVHPMQGAVDYPAVTLPENPLAKLSDAERIDLAMKLEQLALEAAQTRAQINKANHSSVTSGSGGGNSKKTTNEDVTPVAPAEMTVTNQDNGAAIYVPGLRWVSYSELNKMVEAGTVQEIVNGSKVTYKKVW